jgi:hypothetical protein
VFLKFYLSVFREILKCSRIPYFASEKHVEKYVREDAATSIFPTFA